MVICRGSSNLKGGQGTSNRTRALQALLDQRTPVFEPILRYQVLDDDEMSTRTGTTTESAAESSKCQAMIANNPICITKNSATSIFPAIKDKAPTYLLLESLIYSSCERVEPDPEKCKKLFFSLCKYLEKCNFLGSILPNRLVAS